MAGTNSYQDKFRKPDGGELRSPFMLPRTTLEPGCSRKMKTWLFGDTKFDFQNLDDQENGHVTLRSGIFKSKSHSIDLPPGKPVSYAKKFRGGKPRIVNSGAYEISVQNDV